MKQNYVHFDKYFALTSRYIELLPNTFHGQTAPAIASTITFDQQSPFVGDKQLVFHSSIHLCCNVIAQRFCNTKLTDAKLTKYST